MGFFGKLFEKKNCSVCGSEIGLLGNRKLEDGNLCKACEAKLSHWYSGRRNATVEQIKEQLISREENREALKTFTSTCVLGGKEPRVHLDEENRKFLIAYGSDWFDENPDIFEAAQLTDCFLDIEEDETEHYRRQPDGREESFSPPRYVFGYDFHITIRLKHPYVEEVSFDLNDERLELNPDQPAAMSRKPSAQSNREYCRYEQMGKELVERLMALREGERSAQKEAAAPKQAVRCPCCGATTVPDAQYRCEYCDSSLA